MVLEKMSLPTEIIFVYCYKFILLFNFFKFFFNDSSILINIISCDYLNLSLANEYVGDVTIPTQVIKYNQNFLQVDQPIRLQYSNQIILLFVLFLCLVKIVYYCLQVLMNLLCFREFYMYGFLPFNPDFNYFGHEVTIGIIHRFSRLVTLLFHKWLHVRLNHKDACMLT